MTAPRIAVIGAGITGLTCARALAGAGLAPVVIDKGRGIGGRLATRRAGEGLRFDHGATYLVARDPGFAALLAAAQAQGALAPWDAPLRARDAGQAAFVGLPGMSGLARHLGQGLDLRQGVTVTGLDVSPKQVTLRAEGEAWCFDRVILTIPAPQALRLLGAGHALAPALGAVQMAPCLTLMAAFPADRTPPVVTAEGGAEAPLGWVVQDSAKPGRGDGGAETWVAQAGAAFSARHLEMDMAEATALLLPHLCARIGRQPDEAIHAATHRWRYAVTARAHGAPFLADPGRRLLLGGDWCLGPAAEDGWSSGRALAGAVLAGL